MKSLLIFTVALVLLYWIATSIFGRKNPKPLAIQCSDKSFEIRVSQRRVSGFDLYEFLELIQIDPTSKEIISIGEFFGRSKGQRPAISLLLPVIDFYLVKGASIGEGEVSLLIENSSYVNESFDKLSICLLNSRDQIDNYLSNYTQGLLKSYDAGTQYGVAYSLEQKWQNRSYTQPRFSAIYRNQAPEVVSEIIAFNSTQFPDFKIRLDSRDAILTTIAAKGNFLWVEFVAGEKVSDLFMKKIKELESENRQDLAAPLLKILENIATFRNSRGLTLEDYLNMRTAEIANPKRKL